MNDVNWWLMALAFLLGMLITFAMMIRRVTREVPMTLSASAGAGGKLGGPGLDLKGPDLGKIAGSVSAAGAAAASGAAATLSGAADKVGDLAERAGEKVGAAADAVGDAIESVLEREPHGAGSVRMAARRDAPPGYLVKFDAESRRYYVPGAPGYEELETEWWFVDEESAKAAGFSRWDEIKAKVGDFVDRAGDKVGDAVGDAKDALADKIGEAKDAIGDAAEAVGSKVGAAATAAAGLVSIDDVPAGPYGKGSVKANDDGSGPAGWLIKGNADSMLYHPPDSPAYEQTIAEVWFFDEETAKSAGFDKWDKNFR